MRKKVAVNGRSLRWAVRTEAAWVAALLLLSLSACNGTNKPGTEKAPTECQPGVNYSCYIRGCASALEVCTSAGTLLDCVCVTSASGGDDSTGADDMDASMGDAAVGDSDSGTEDSSMPGPTGELCDNGVDDDGDGDIDCADEDCLDRLCVDEAPEGWQGPVSTGADSCGAAYSEEVTAGGQRASGDAASCASCQCTPGECAAALTVEMYEGQACEQAADNVSISASCTVLDVGLAPGSASLQLAPPSDASACVPGSAVATLEPAELTEELRVCSPSAAVQRGGCERGRLCAPAAADVQAPLCIVREGEHACPPGEYHNRTMLYRDLADTRACTECGCDNRCSYALRVYAADDDACAGDPTTTAVPGDGCTPITVGDAGVPLGVEISGAGTCSSDGGEPTGDVQGLDPVTVCCNDGG